MARVLITGGTGLIGKALTKKLLEKGHEVFHLSRSAKNTPDVKTFTWNITEKEIPSAALKVDYIVHLAGANISDKRWTTKRKKELYSSRIDSLTLIKEKLNEINHQPKALIAAAGISYYGMLTTETIFSEEATSADDYLGAFCKDWEAAAEGFNIRRVLLRTGIVLSKDGGALPKFLPAIKMGIGSALGSGKQYMPWIHISDLVDIYLKAIEEESMQGIYNAVAPEHVTNKGLMKKVAKILKRPFFFPNVPAFVLQILFGELSQAILTGSRVSAEKIQGTGFEFQFPEVEGALNNLLKE